MKCGCIGHVLALLRVRGMPTQFLSSGVDVLLLLFGLVVLEQGLST